MSNFNDTTHLVILGHEGWLEFRSSHAHHGSPVDLIFKWGHNMETDGLCKKEILRAYLVDPNGKKSDLEIPDADGDAYQITFTPEGDGLYRPVVEADGITTVTIGGKCLDLPKRDCEFPLEAVAFTQYASVVVPVGHDLEGAVPPAGGAFELQPACWKPWRVGDTIEMQVRINGSTAAGTEVALINGMADEHEVPMLKESDGKGMLTFTFEKPGFYLAMARYANNGDYKEEYYDRRNYTTTLHILVTK